MGVIAHSPEAWGQAMAALLPQGAAWPRDPASILMQLVSGLAVEPSRAEDRLADLIDEADPDSALELLAAWERVVGLPDPCNPVGGSTRERQRAVVQRMTATGGQSIPYFTGIAAAMGVNIVIEEHDAATCVMGCEDPVNGPEWAFAWSVVVIDADDVGDFFDVWATCDSACDEPLRAFGSGQLECRIRAAAPAHTIPIFTYDPAPEPLFWFDFLNL